MTTVISTFQNFPDDVATCAEEQYVYVSRLPSPPAYGPGRGDGSEVAASVRARWQECVGHFKNVRRARENEIECAVGHAKRQLARRKTSGAEARTGVVAQ
jgi:hypothetical protein